MYWYFYSQGKYVTTSGKSIKIKEDSIGAKLWGISMLRCQFQHKNNQKKMTKNKEWDSISCTVKEKTFWKVNTLTTIRITSVSAKRQGHKRSIVPHHFQRLCGDGSQIEVSTWTTPSQSLALKEGKEFRELRKEKTVIMRLFFFKDLFTTSCVPNHNNL